MTKKYRIVKETGSRTHRVRYYIERQRRFLKWRWWSKLDTYIPEYDITTTLDFSTIDEAKDYLNRLLDHKTTEVCEVVE